MSKRCLKNAGRQRAFWGAVIPAIASVVGTAISSAASSNAQRNAINEQKKEQERQNLIQQQIATANNLNNYFANSQEDDDENRYTYKKGGRRKLRNAAQITDGGYAIPIDYSTYLLQGGSHNQVNETGQTGIGINAGGKEIEAEGGEVIQRKGNELRVFSNQPILNGVSPSEAVLEGANKNEVFKAQEAIKRRYSLRNGYSSPVGNRRKALWGAEFTTPDYIGLGTNIGASLLSGIIANKQYNDILRDINYEIPSYVDATYVSGPTKYFNAAQRGNVEQNRLNSNNIIARNTASANVANSRMQDVNTEALAKLNELWDVKANKEVELRQANAERQQRVRLANAENKNRWLASVADIRNKQLANRLALQEAKINSNVGMIQGIGSSIGGFLQQGIDNYQADQSRRLLLATSQYGTAERAAQMGFTFNKDLMETLKNDAQSRIDMYENDNSEAGIKARNDAQQSYDFWTNQLNSYNTSRPSIWSRLFGRKAIRDELTGLTGANARAYIRRNRI